MHCIYSFIHYSRKFTKNTARNCLPQIHYFYFFVPNIINREIYKCGKTMYKIIERDESLIQKKKGKKIRSQM